MSDKKHAGSFHWACQLYLDCPNCDEQFDLLDIDDYGEIIGSSQVCEAKKGAEVFCPKCEKEFVFDIDGGL